MQRCGDACAGAGWPDGIGALIDTDESTDQLLYLVYIVHVIIQLIFAELASGGERAQVFASRGGVGDELVIRRDGDVLAILRLQDQQGNLHVLLFLRVRLLQCVLLNRVIRNEQGGARTQQRAQQQREG